MSTDLTSRMTELKKLLDAGLLTLEEFASEKAALLAAHRGSVSTPASTLSATNGAKTSDQASSLPGTTRVGGAVSIPERLGCYRVLGFEGSGGMGSVVRARHVEEGWAQRQGGDVAIKLVHNHLSVDPDFRERFLDEAQLGRRVRHASLAQVHDVIVEGPWLGIAMSYVDGQPLSDWVRPGGIPLSEVLVLLSPLAAAIDHLHVQGIVHRDLKPANIKVRADGVPVILDLGIAKDLNADSGRTRTAVAMGTTTWMAPEQADSKRVSAAADRYSFGLIAYALLSGRLPWADETSELRVASLKLQGKLEPLAVSAPGMGSRVSSAVMQMLSLEPSARFGSCLTFVDALESARVFRQRSAREAEEARRFDDSARNEAWRTLVLAQSGQIQNDVEQWKSAEVAIQESIKELLAVAHRMPQHLEEVYRVLGNLQDVLDTGRKIVRRSQERTEEQIKLLADSPD